MAEVDKMRGFGSQPALATNQSLPTFTNAFGSMGNQYSLSQPGAMINAKNTTRSNNRRGSTGGTAGRGAPTGRGAHHQSRGRSLTSPTLTNSEGLTLGKSGPTESCVGMTKMLYPGAKVDDDKKKDGKRERTGGDVPEETQAKSSK